MKSDFYQRAKVEILGRLQEGKFECLENSLSHYPSPFLPAETTTFAAHFLTEFFTNKSQF